MRFLTSHLSPIQMLQIVVFGPSLAIALAGILGIAIIVFRPLEDWP